MRQLLKSVQLRRYSRKIVLRAQSTLGNITSTHPDGLLVDNLDCDLLAGKQVRREFHLAEATASKLVMK